MVYFIIRRGNCFSIIKSPSFDFEEMFLVIHLQIYVCIAKVIALNIFASLLYCFCIGSWFLFYIALITVITLLTIATTTVVTPMLALLGNSEK